MTTESNNIIDQIDVIKALLGSFDEQHYVSQYSVTREYGGPEEGGWWYDDRQFDRVIGVFGNHDDAMFFAKSMNTSAKEEQQHDGLHDRFSVLGGADLVYDVESRPNESTTTERPHYE